MSRRLSWMVIFIMGFLSVAAQQQQLWLDYQLDYPFANRYLFEANASYQTVLTRQNKWRSIYISPTVEYSLSTKIDLISELPLAFTLQRADTNSFEISPYVGARYHISQNKRVNTRFLLKYQQRYFHQVEANDWDISNRIRLKIEATISINAPNLFADRLWYAILDFEEFVVVDKQVMERYANRRRGRIGIGYRLNYKHRFDMIYTLQSSRNEIAGSFVSNDNILQLRYKVYFNPTTAKN